MQVAQVKIGSIHPFPNQYEIYGFFVPENEKALIDSVRDVGILTPITITPVALFKEFYEQDGGPVPDYICISGHRRLEAAKNAGLDAVPAIIKVYDDIDDAELDFFVQNFNREKTKAQRIEEFLRLKTVLNKVANLKKINNLKHSLIDLDTSLARVLGDVNLSSLFEYEESLDTYGILKKITGLSEYEQTMLNIVLNDEYIDKEMTKLGKRGVKQSKIDALYEDVIALRQAYRNGTITLYSAADQIKQEIADLNGKAKKREKRAPRPAADDEGDELPLMHEIDKSAIADELTTITLDGPKLKAFNLCFFVSGASGLVYTSGKKYFSVRTERLIEILDESI